MSLHSTTHCCLTRSVPLGGAQVLTLALHGRRLDRASISQSGRSLSSLLGPQPHEVAPMKWHRLPPEYLSTPDISTNGMLFSQTTCYCYLYEKCFSVFVFKLVSCSCIYSQTVGGLPRIPCSLQAASRKQREKRPEQGPGVSPLPCSVLGAQQTAAGRCSLR